MTVSPVDVNTDIHGYELEEEESFKNVSYNTFQPEEVDEEKAQELLERRLIEAKTQANISALFQPSLFSCQTEKEARDVVEFWENIFSDIQDSEIDYSSFLKDLKRSADEERIDIQNLLKYLEESSPEEWPDMQKLFDLEKDQFQSLPVFAQHYSQTLYSLFMKYPCLTSYIRGFSGIFYKELPDFLATCSNLVYLGTEEKAVEKFSQIGQLKKLEYIILEPDFNEDFEPISQEVKLPASFYQLSHLKIIFCYNLTLEQIQKLGSKEFVLTNKDGYYIRDQEKLLFHPFDDECCGITGEQFQLLSPDGKKTQTNEYDLNWFNEKMDSFMNIFKESL